MDTARQQHYHVLPPPMLPSSCISCLSVNAVLKMQQAADGLPFRRHRVPQSHMVDPDQGAVSGVTIREPGLWYRKW